MDFFIFQQPLIIRGDNTSTFNIYPLSIIDYYTNANLFTILSVTKEYLLQQIDVKQKDVRKYVEENITHFDVVATNGTALKQLIDLLSLVSKKDTGDFILQKDEKGMYYILIDGFIINRDNYDHIRNSIIRANNLKLPKQAKTAELQKWWDKSRNLKNKKEDGANLTDIVTTIVATTGLSFKDIQEMSIYQVNHLIARINKLKQYEAQIQFISAGAADIKLTNYLEHIADDYEEKLSTSLADFQNKFGG